MRCEGAGTRQSVLHIVLIMGDMARVHLEARAYHILSKYPLRGLSRRIEDILKNCFLRII